MAKITLSGNFNFDYDNIDDLLAADIIKMVIERQYGPKTECQSRSRKRHIQAVDSREEQPEPHDSEPP